MAVSARGGSTVRLPVVEGPSETSKDGKAVDDDYGERDEEQPGPLGEGEGRKREHGDGKRGETGEGTRGWVGVGKDAG